MSWVFFLMAAASFAMAVSVDIAEEQDMSREH